MKQRLILDCTLRDGGLGFEDVGKSSQNYPCFTDVDQEQIAKKLTLAGLDIIELGSIEKTDDDKRKFAIYQNIEQISYIMPKKTNSQQLFTALYRGPDTPINEIPEWKQGLCEAVRVILRYSELKKSLDFCKCLAKKGYKVFVQPMLTMRYTQDEIQMVLDAANDMGAFATYFVDSYGYMQADDVKYFFERYDRVLDSNIKIGFHAHNNKNLAFSNALAFLSNESDRDIITDSCIMGLGQGAGNLQTEIISDHYIHSYGKEYDFGLILDACEIIEQYWTQNTWGYSVINFIPTRHRAAYKYALAMRNVYGLSYREIDKVFSKMDYDLRQRYTNEHLQQILK